MGADWRDLMPCPCCGVGDLVPGPGEPDEYGTMWHALVCHECSAEGHEYPAGGFPTLGALVDGSVTSDRWTDVDLGLYVQRLANLWGVTDG